jgi:hypothetical protein
MSPTTTFDAFPRQPHGDGLSDALRATHHQGNLLGEPPVRHFVLSNLPIPETMYC